MERRSREPDANLPIIPINVNKVVHQAIFNMYEEGTEHSQPTGKYSNIHLYLFRLS